MQTFCAAYEAAGGGFQYPSADKTTLNGALMTLIERDTIKDFKRSFPPQTFARTFI